MQLNERDERFVEAASGAVAFWMRSRGLRRYVWSEAGQESRKESISFSQYCSFFVRPETDAEFFEALDRWPALWAEIMRRAIRKARSASDATCDPDAEAPTS